MFTEDVIEKMIIDSLVRNGWEYIPAENLPRNYTDVMVEPMVRDALIRLNPEIAANPSLTALTQKSRSPSLMDFSSPSNLGLPKEICIPFECP